MALILNIDTAIEIAGVCLSKDGATLITLQSDDQKTHAAWLHVSIEKIMHQSGFAIKDLNAIAVAIGPGSYTGLRVGMAAAKGLCYALHIPFITASTLELMAFSVQSRAIELSALICPMIDARRMEVFTALYNKEVGEVMAPAAMILNKNSFEDYLSIQNILFIGSGTRKLAELISTPTALFADTPLLAPYLGKISHNKYLTREFSDLIYSEPAYLKEFYTHEKK
jgi:tRNA threonylcarbamoyladenosine biosynthesis protein TsaB